MEDRFKFRFWNKSRKIMETFNNSPLTLGGLLLGKNDNYEILSCTGLKDKNGKLIYEGDIVTYDWLTPIGKVWRIDDKHIVEWHNGFTVIGNIAGYDVEHGKTRNVEVIGNIYENPELLED